nr:hypothetical protein CFP56_66617 [Quercus suber]
MWSTIEKLRKKSGFGWDDNLKMITCDAKTYQEEVMAHRKHAEFLNKKIEMYDELAIVVGKDTATGGFSKSYVDIENEPDNGDSAEFVADNVEEDVVEKDSESKPFLSPPLSLFLSLIYFPGYKLSITEQNYSLSTNLFTL